MIVPIHECERFVIGKRNAFREIPTQCHPAIKAWLVHAPTVGSDFRILRSQSCGRYTRRQRKNMADLAKRLLHSGESYGGCAWFFCSPHPHTDLDFRHGGDLCLFGCLILRLYASLGASITVSVDGCSALLKREMTELPWIRAHPAGAETRRVSESSERPTPGLLIALVPTRAVARLSVLSPILVDSPPRLDTPDPTPIGSRPHGGLLRPLSAG